MRVEVLAMMRANFSKGLGSFDRQEGRSRQYGLPKCLCKPTKLHGASAQNILTLSRAASSVVG